MHTNIIHHHGKTYVSRSNSYIHTHKHHTPYGETHGSSGNSYINAHQHNTHHGETHVSSGNSEPKVTGAARAARKGNGVAIPQPRVAGEARYPG